MAGHHHEPAAPAEPWPGGWLWALVAGIVAAILASWLGDVGAVTAVLIGIFVFLVFGVLLGMFWDPPSPHALGANAGGHHGHDDHGHDDHGHDHDHDHDHGHHVHKPVETPAAVKAAPAAAPARPPVVAAAPAAEVPHVPVASPGPTKPVALAAPKGGKADDLKEIEGIGPALEKLCHELGIYHFDQIAAWGAAEVEWMDGNLKGFKGRVTRDKWVAQAKIIVAEGLETFRIRAKTNDY